jgi:hypothetical protein
VVKRSPPTTTLLRNIIMALIEIYRIKIDPADVERLLEIRVDAVAEFQQQVPELLQADLVRLEEGVCSTS